MVLGRGAVQLVTRTMNDLFFVVAVREIDIPTWTLVKGAAIGIGAALLGAAVPALEATSVPPAGALQAQQRGRAHPPRPAVGHRRRAGAALAGRGAAAARVESGGDLRRSLRRHHRLCAAHPGGDTGPHARGGAAGAPGRRHRAHGPAHGDARSAARRWPWPRSWLRSASSSAWAS
ncbi:MAG: hypothetical protein R2854_02060 [Caldilineaceae bacterium]